MKRIQREKTHEAFVKEMTTGDGAIFKEIWRLLLLAASIGWKAGVRKPLGAVDSGKAMPDSYFSIPAWRGLLYLLGVAESEDSKCLQSREEEQNALITAFEEYANHGLYVLQDRVRSKATALDDIVSLILESNLKNGAMADLSGLEQL